MNFYDMLLNKKLSGGGGGGGSATLIEKNISANGTYKASSDSADGYSKVVVNVPASAVDTGTKEITENGNNQDVVGYAAVNVNVPNTYAAGDEGKVVSNGALVAQTSDTVTQNDTYDTTLINSLTVAVSGGASYEGVEVKCDANGKVTDYIVHMEEAPDWLLNYIQWNHGSGDGAYPTISFDGTKKVGKNCIATANCHVDWSGLDELIYVRDYGLAANVSSNVDRSAEVVNLPSFIGYYDNTYSAISVFRVEPSRSTYAPKKYVLPVCAIIPQYAWYQARTTDLDITIGSVGHAVTESKQQPFGGTSNATGTIVIYTDGSHLDTVKTEVMNSAGSNLTFTFKASENTTYGGSSYNAGDTILTV